MSHYFNHLKTVMTHKYWVFYYCREAGMPFRGLLHDLSKFTPIEFIESAKYWSGTRSPIDACKEENGISYAWMHHKGHNPHHWEYWMDNFSNGGVPRTMPYKCAVEMICDYMGAGRAYMGEEFSYDAEYGWWLNKRKSVIMTPEIMQFTDCCMNFAVTHDRIPCKKEFTHFYNTIVSKKEIPYNYCPIHQTEEEDA